MPRAVIFANGQLPDPDLARALLKPEDVFLAADGGTRHALALGVFPAVVIGDMDSLSLPVQQTLEMAGVRFIRHPTDKNENDLELVLKYAMEQNFNELLIIGGLGGRLDQTLGNLALLSVPELSDLDIRLDDGLEEAFFVTSKAKVEGRLGDTVSLIPWGGEVGGVVTKGLKWPLHDETLHPDKTRGISNEIIGAPVSISIRSGTLLVVHRRKSSA